MSRFVRLFIGAAMFMLLSSGKLARHSVWLVVNNSSADGKAVDMKFSITPSGSDKPVLDAQQVEPGLLLLPEKKLKEGAYHIHVNTNGETVTATQQFTVDSDRWILVNYIRQDSASLVKTYGYLDPARFKKVGDQYATVYLSVESRKPAGL